MARRRLKALKHTDSIHDYVKKFASIMLDIQDMSEKDKIFSFLEGLKPWARQELQRQGVQDLASAQAAAERLTDYAEDSRKNQANTSTINPGGKKNGGNKPWQTKSGGGDKTQVSSSSAPRDDRTNTGRRPLKCFLCGGPHKVSVCRHNGKLTALQSEIRQHPTEEDTEDEEENIRMGALRFLTALKKQGSTAKKSEGKGLMFIDAAINGKAAKSVMIDTGATHNFISVMEARRLGLKLDKDPGRIDIESRIRVL